MVKKCSGLQSRDKTLFLWALAHAPYTVHLLLCDLVSTHEFPEATPSSQNYLQEKQAAIGSVSNVQCGTQKGLIKKLLFLST